MSETNSLNTHNDSTRLIANYTSDEKNNKICTSSNDSWHLIYVIIFALIYFKIL